MAKGIQLTDGFVLLRPYRTEDLEDLHTAILESMAELTPYLDFARDGYSFEQSKEWVTTRSDEWNKGISYDFAITDASNGQYLGGCGLNKFDAERRIGNMGYWVRTSRTKCGVATATVVQLARFGIKELRLKRITLAIATHNKASQRVAEKGGAAREGVLRNGMFVRDLMYDCIIYSIIPQDLELPLV